MFALYMFGSDIERLFGSRFFAAYYFVAVLAAAISHLVVTAWITRRSTRLIETSGRVCLEDGAVVAEASAKQFIAGSAPGRPDRVRETRRHV